MKLCLICKKRFELIDKHHVSYEFNNLIEVCKSCHRKIHNGKYPQYEPIDKDEFSSPQIKEGNKITCCYCSYEWKLRKKNPVACPRCKKRFDYPEK